MIKTYTNIIRLVLYTFCHYNKGMGKKIGRPVQSQQQAKTSLLQVRLNISEKHGFSDAANLAGLALSAWARERLRWAAIRELQSANHQVAFLETLASENEYGSNTR